MFLAAAYWKVTGDGSKVMPILRHLSGWTPFRIHYANDMSGCPMSSEPGDFLTAVASAREITFRLGTTL